MLQACKSAEETTSLSRAGQDAFLRLEHSQKPIVAAIMGSCMGGGFELALACHYRIAVDDKKTRLALPEVMLGLLPGAGGTQRLVRLAGLTNALDMAMTGKQLAPSKAKKMGLVHQVVEPIGSGLEPGDSNTHKYLQRLAVEAARQLADGKLSAEKKLSIMETTVNFLLNLPPIRDYIYLPFVRYMVNKQLAKTGGKYPAPAKILKVMEIGFTKGEAAGYEAEAIVSPALLPATRCRRSANCRKHPSPRR